jgi:4a-hydroxytetrahydrobiopterin dehydratase
MNLLDKLLDKRCVEGAAALTPEAITELLAQVPGWSVVDGKLQRLFAFGDYHETIEFVNALAWMVHAQDHHPELLVTYRHCNVAYTTHSAGNALSENDFISAAKANAIYQQRASA